MIVDPSEGREQVVQAPANDSPVPTVVDEAKGIPQNTVVLYTLPVRDSFLLLLDQEIEVTRKRIDKLQKEYVAISVCVAEKMSKNVKVKTLRYTLLCLPPNLKKEYRKFVREAKAEMNEAKSSEEIIDVIGENFDYLNYSLLGYVVNLYGSDGLKKRMAEYVKMMESFRKETRLEVFSEVCNDKPEKINGRFATIVTEHKLDWKTATLEFVEKIRIDVCRDLSLYDFSLKLLKVARGCVEVTWRVPRSLVTFIQNCVKPSSQSMTDHNVTTLTIDGFIAYHSSFGIHYLTIIAYL